MHFIALLHESESFGRAVRPGELVGLVDAVERAAQRQRVAGLQLHAGFELARQARPQRRAAVAGPVRRLGAQRQALAVAQVHRGRRIRLPQHGSLGQHLAQACRAFGRAAVVVAALVQAGEAGAGDQLPMLAQVHAIQREQRVLPAGESTLRGTGLVGRGSEDRRVELVDVAGADIVVDIGAAVDGATERAGAEAQFVAQRAGGEAAFKHGAGLVADAGVVGAAEIVDVVVAVRREEPAGHAAVGTFAGIEAAVGERHVVVDHATAVAAGDSHAPVVIEDMFNAHAAVGRLDAHRLLPRLIAEHACGVRVRRQRGAAEQLVARHRALAAGLVVAVQFQRGAFADLPVRRQRQHAAPAVGVMHVRMDVLVDCVDAHAELRREPAAEIHRDVARAVRIDAEGDAAHVGRPLADVIDHAAGLHHAGFQPGQSLQDLHLLHVLQRHLLLAGDGQAVAAEAGGRVQRIAADCDVLVVADRRVVVAQRGILAGQLAERADLPVVQLLARHHGDRRRRVVQRGTAVAVEAAVVHARGHLSAHVHGGQVDGLRGFGLRGGAAGGGRAGRGKGGKQGKGEGSADHRRRLRVADEATASGSFARTIRLCKLPTPVLTGSGSKGLSQPGVLPGTPASRPLLKHGTDVHGESANLTPARGCPAAAPVPARWRTMPRVHAGRCPRRRRRAPAHA